MFNKRVFDIFGYGYFFSLKTMSKMITNFITDEYEQVFDTYWTETVLEKFFAAFLGTTFSKIEHLLSFYEGKLVKSLMIFPDTGFVCFRNGFNYLAKLRESF